MNKTEIRNIALDGKVHNSLYLDKASLPRGFELNKKPDNIPFTWNSDEFYDGVEINDSRVLRIYVNSQRQKLTINGENVVYIGSTSESKLFGKITLIELENSGKSFIDGGGELVEIDGYRLVSVGDRISQRDNMSGDFIISENTPIGDINYLTLDVKGDVCVSETGEILTVDGHKVLEVSKELDHLFVGSFLKLKLENKGNVYVDRNFNTVQLNGEDLVKIGNKEETIFGNIYEVRLKNLGLVYVDDDGEIVKVDGENLSYIGDINKTIFGDLMSAKIRNIGQVYLDKHMKPVQINGENLSNIRENVYTPFGTLTKAQLENSGFVYIDSNFDVLRLNGEIVRYFDEFLDNYTFGSFIDVDLEKTGSVCVDMDGNLLEIEDKVVRNIDSNNNGYVFTFIDGTQTWMSNIEIKSELSKDQTKRGLIDSFKSN